MRLAQPLRTESVTDLLVGSRGKDEVARRLEALTCERCKRDSTGCNLPLHVERPAPPHRAVAQLAAERVRAPLGRVREHDIGVREEEQRRPVAATRDARNEVCSFRHPRVQLHLRAVFLEVLAEKLCRGGLVARRVGRVHADELLQELGHLVAERNRRHRLFLLFLRTGGQLVPRTPEGREEVVVDHLSEHLDRGALSPDDLVADDP